jgi:formate dehydrogenase subunit gamma
MAAPIAWDESLARETIEELRGLEGPLLPILHALQDRFGYVDARAVGMIAKSLNLSRAEVFGTLSFYHDFRKQPPLGHAIKLCRAEACQARGAEELAARLEQKHGLKIDGGYRNGLAVDTVYCLGNCAIGPNALFDGEIFARLDEARLDALCARAAQSAGAKP